MVNQLTSWYPRIQLVLPRDRRHRLAHRREVRSLRYRNGSLSFTNNLKYFQFYKIFPCLQFLSLVYLHKHFLYKMFLQKFVLDKFCQSCPMALAPMASSKRISTS